MTLLCGLLWAYRIPYALFIYVFILLFIYCQDITISVYTALIYDKI